MNPTGAMVSQDIFLVTAKLSQRLTYPHAAQTMVSVVEMEGLYCLTDRGWDIKTQHMQMQIWYCHVLDAHKK